MTTERVMLCCPHCGSEDIARDAAAKWDADTQQWSLAGVHDDMTCQDCGENFKIANEKPYAPATEPTAAGLQYVIPGCEKQTAPGKSQEELF